MSKEVTTRGVAVPDHIRARFNAQTNSELGGGITVGFPVISYKGKVWALVEGGERTIMVNGEGEPRASIQVVIVKASPHVSKVYYASGYEEGSTEQPDCHSYDGVAPAADSPRPQCSTCAGCPHNVWGSKITESGKKTKACADVKRLAVADAEDLNKVCLLRVPAASLSDLKAYADLLTKHGIPYQYAVTKVSFDPEMAYPKLKYKVHSWLGEEDIGKVDELVESDVVARILGLDPASHAHAAPAAKQDDDELPPLPAHLGGKGEAPKPAAAPKAAAKKKPELVPSAEELAEVIEGASEEKVVNLAERKAAPAPAKSQSVDALIADADAELGDILAGLDETDD